MQDKPHDFIMQGRGPRFQGVGEYEYNLPPKPNPPVRDEQKQVIRTILDKALAELTADSPETTTD